MKIHTKDCRVREGEEVDLKKRPTTVDPVYGSTSRYQAILAQHVEKLSALQQLHYDSSRHAVLLIFQAMDAAGKDGAIRHVMSGVNPQGCQVFSFKHPSAVELEHDFLWRTTRDLPERGQIGIFNRSYYEEVLIVRVHHDILRNEDIPDAPHHDGKVWQGRCRSDVDLERHLHANGTIVVKIFLHLSKEEQRLRFLDRINPPDKNWKVSTGDIEERKFWKKYRTAYEECLSATSTDDSPWYVVPADDKENARLIVSQIVVDTLEALGMYYPKISAKRARELQSIKKGLTPAPTAADAATCIVLIDHHHAKIFPACHRHTATNEPIVVKPADDDGSHRRVTHRQGDDDHDGGHPLEDTAYYERITADLGPATRIVVLRDGKGRSNAGNQFIDHMKQLHGEVAHRIVATDRVDISQLSDGEIVEAGLALVPS